VGIVSVESIQRFAANDLSYQILNCSFKTLRVHRILPSASTTNYHGDFISPNNRHLFVPVPANEEYLDPFQGGFLDEQGSFQLEGPRPRRIAIEQGSVAGWDRYVSTAGRIWRSEN
jgi:hypothetical protein